MREVGVTEERRRKFGLMAQKNFVFGIRDLTGRELKGIDPDAVDGALIVLAGGGAHEENASGDGNHLCVKVWERGLGECGHSPNREASINSLGKCLGEGSVKSQRLLRKTRERREKVLTAKIAKNCRENRMWLQMMAREGRFDEVLEVQDQA
jgi:hypothetical protein